ncbi:MAG: tetratricopeptide repeat protein [Marinilabiliaceae bacterium]|nr:tetratricopeptide repeat protein [Marinilabiliaceae bacterium]
MRLFFLGFTLLLILFGCKSNRSFTIHSYPPVPKVDLTEENARKFDYFFYEANKEKFLGNYEKSVTYYAECLRIDSTSSVCLYELANIYSGINQYGKAAELMQKAVHFNPLNEWYQLALADLFHRTEKISEAIKIYEHLVKIKPQSEEYLYTLSQLYAQSNQFTLALKTLDRLESEIGFNETIIMEKMKIYIHLNNEKLSYAEVEKLIKKYPGQVIYLGYLADLYSYFKKYDKAITTYTKMLSMDPTYESVYFSMASIYYQRNDTLLFKTNYSKAINSKHVALEQKIQKLIPFLISDNPESSSFNDNELEQFFQQLLILHPFDSQGYILYGNFLRNRGKSDLALVKFQTAIELEPTNEQLWQDILFLQAELRLFTDMLLTGNNALSYFPSNGVITLLYSSALMQCNKANEAVSVINAIVDTITNNPPLKGQLYALLGDAAYKAGLSDTAFVAYDEALKINDRNLGVLNNYSYYLSLDNRDLDKAEKMSSRTIELEPGNSTFLDTYAWILFKKGRYLEAKFIIERAIDNGGDTNFEIVEHYGDILYFNGDVQNAIIQWEKAHILMQSHTDESIDSKRLHTIQQKILNRRFID